VSRYKKLAAYLLFACAVTLFFVYFSFPAQTVCGYLEESVGRRFPFLSLKIQRVKPVLPLGIQLHQALLTNNKNPSIFLFKADSFVVMPSTKMVFTGRPAVDFDCRAYGGRIKGVVVFKNFNLGPPFRTDLDFTGLQLDRYTIIKERLNRACSGVMSGTVSYEVPGSDLLQATGEANISILNGSVRFTEPFFGLTSLDFDLIQAQIHVKAQKLVIDRVDFRGAQIIGEGAGSISLHRNLKQSNLNFTIAVQPSADLFKENSELENVANVFLKHLDGDRFTVKIRGTIAQPRASFM